MEEGRRHFFFNDGIFGFYYLARVFLIFPLMKSSLVTIAVGQAQIDSGGLVFDPTECHIAGSISTVDFSVCYVLVLEYKGNESRYKITTHTI